MFPNQFTNSKSLQRKKILSLLFNLLFILSITSSSFILFTSIISSPVQMLIVIPLIVIGFISSLFVLSLSLSLSSDKKVKEQASKNLVTGYAGFLDVFDGLPAGFTIAYKGASQEPVVDNENSVFNTHINFGNGRVIITKIETGFLRITSDPDLKLLIKDRSKNKTTNVGDWS